jgi:hypothetical protein
MVGESNRREALGMSDYAGVSERLQEEPQIRPWKFGFRDELGNRLWARLVKIGEDRLYIRIGDEVTRLGIG